MLHEQYYVEKAKQERILAVKNEPARFYNGIFTRYKNPVLTREHIPLTWRYDLDTKTNPFFEERLGVNAVFNSGAISLNGKYYLVARIESPDLVYWGRHRHVMGRSEKWWESVKIGAGAAPIETSEGWLLFYHGVTGTCNGLVYSIGGAILDRDEPSKVLYRCKTFLLTLEEWYEERGFVPNVCFPCATIHDADTGRIAIYYGCADSYVSLAFTRLDLIIDYIKENSVIRESDSEEGRR